MEQYNEIISTLQKIKEQLDPETIQELTSCSYYKLYNYHFGLGLWIRNTLLKPDSSLFKLFRKLGVFQKDDMSTLLIEWLFLYLKNEQITKI